MFEDLRYNLKHNRKSVMKRLTAAGLFAAIILVFVFWGLQPKQAGVAEGGAAAVVNDSTISLAQYSEMMERMRHDPRFEQMQQLGGDAARQILQSQAISQLVELELVRQATIKQHLVSSDREIADVITNIPAFQDKGRFSREIYDRYLASVRKTPGQFEDEIRREQSLRRTVQLFHAALSPIPLASEKQKSLAAMRANLEYLSAPSDTLVAPASVSSADIKAFTDKPDSSTKIKDYFDGHKSEFSKEESVHARHILIKTVEGDDASDKAAHEKADKIAARAKKEDFAKLAKEFSDDPGSKNKGGDLGQFHKGQMVPEFETAAFNQPLKEVGAPVKSQFGYHIIQVLDRTPASSQTLDQAKNDIAQKLIAKEKSHQALEALEAELKKGDTAAANKFAAAHGLKWEETGAFSVESEQIPKIGANNEILQAAFSLTADKPMADRLFREGPSAYVIRYKAAAPLKGEADAKTNDVAAQFYANRSSEDALRGWLEGLRKEAKISTNTDLK